MGPGEGRLDLLSQPREPPGRLHVTESGLSVLLEVWMGKKVGGMGRSAQPSGFPLGALTSPPWARREAEADGDPSSRLLEKV